jgi:hypothetical protein
MMYSAYSIAGEKSKIAISKAIIALVNTYKTRYAGKKSSHGPRRYSEINRWNIELDHGHLSHS